MKLFFSDSIDYVDTWKAMEKLVELGLVRSIGLSNFNSEQIDRILKIATIKPVVNQVECSPVINQRKFIKFCKERDITIIAYSPLAITAYSQKLVLKGNLPDYATDEKVKEIAKKYNKSTTQIALRYLV